MGLLNIILGIVTFLAFFLNIYQLLDSRANQRIEEGKALASKERVQRAKYAMITAGETIDLIVKRTSDSNCTMEEIANIGRVARGQLVMAVRELENAEENLSSWKFGRFSSASIEDGSTGSHEESEVDS